MSDSPAFLRDFAQALEAEKKAEQDAQRLKFARDRARAMKSTPAQPQHPQRSTAKDAAHEKCIADLQAEKAFRYAHKAAAASHEVQRVAEKERKREEAAAKALDDDWEMVGKDAGEDEDWEVVTAEEADDKQEQISASGSRLSIMGGGLQ